MSNTQNPQNNKNNQTHQTNQPKNQQTHGDVRQDKTRFFSARTASQQPDPANKSMRAWQMESTSVRLQNHSTKNQKAVKVTIWVKPIVKTELERIAEQETLSVSATGAAFLEKALQQNIDMQYAALLQPIIEQAIAKGMRAISTRLAWLLIRVAFDTGQTRSMVTNILGRQPGVTPDILKTILKGSGETAKANITRRTPQIVELIEAVEKWIIEEDRKENAPRD